jgi:hypothetical protein
MAVSFFYLFYSIVYYSLIEASATMMVDDMNKNLEPSGTPVGSESKGLKKFPA